MGLERGLTEFTVNFVLVGMGHELVEQTVGPEQFEDAAAANRGARRFCQ